MAAPHSNLLLDALAPEDRTAILSLAVEVTLPLRAYLHTQDQAPQHIVFLTSGMASVVVGYSDGGSSETLVIGREGITGALSLLGPSPAPADCFMQLPGTGWQVPLGTMRRLFAASPNIRSRILECIQQQSMTTMQIAACNIAHEAEPRLARWLLMVQDRTGDDVLQLTQEFLAQMIGARRTTVVAAAGELQRNGLIEYSRGKVRILSREKLEVAACGCYAVTRRLLRNLYR